LLSVAAEADAHGAFPQVRQVVADPGNATRLWARATHGVLRSDDAGKSWSWLCTFAAGFGTTGSPSLAVGADGRVLSATLDGLYSSPNGGCDWSAPGGMPARTVAALVSDPKNPSRLLALTSESAASGSGFESSLDESLDSGTSFAPLSAALDSGTLFLGLGISASEPSRLYLSGVSSAKGVLMRSTDGGKTWEPAVELPLPPGTAPVVVAVHPTNPERVYVVANASSTSSSKGTLLASADGGQSFAAALEKNAPLMGFALSPDGSRAFASYGDPKGGAVVDESSLGLYSAATDADGFDHVQQGPVACVTFVGAELWACTAQFFHGFELGRSVDGGKTFAPVMELPGLDGPLACPAGSTVATTCTAELWDDVCTDIGKCTGGGDGADAADDGGCGCRTRAPSPGAGWALLCLAALGRFRRRR
jgi:MYXO-CTERM domain-containing protein